MKEIIVDVTKRPTVTDLRILARIAGHRPLDKPEHMVLIGHEYSWCPDENIKQAWELLDAIQCAGFRYYLDNDPPKWAPDMYVVKCSIYHIEAAEGIHAYADTPQLAICNAVLKAVDMELIQ